MKYFNIREFEASDTARRLGIDNTIPDEYYSNIIELVDKILDPLREDWGSGIRITSGYRSSRLNNALHGSKTSAHCKALAADMVPVNGDIEGFKEFVLNWLEGKKFDQYIDETDGSSSWVHIGIRNNKGEQRRQFLKYINKKYSYIKFV